MVKIKKLLSSQDKDSIGSILAKLDAISEADFKSALEKAYSNLTSIIDEKDTLNKNYYELSQKFITADEKIKALDSKLAETRELLLAKEKEISDLQQRLFDANTQIAEYKGKNEKLIKINELLENARNSLQEQVNGDKESEYAAIITSGKASVDMERENTELRKIINSLGYKILRRKNRIECKRASVVSIKTLYDFDAFNLKLHDIITINQYNESPILTEILQCYENSVLFQKDIFKVIDYGRLKRSIEEDIRINDIEVSATVTTSKGDEYKTTLNSCSCKDKESPCKHMYRLAAELGLISYYDIFFKAYHNELLHLINKSEAELAELDREIDKKDKKLLKKKKKSASKDDAV